jgi:hypothetical protein
MLVLPIRLVLELMLEFADCDIAILEVRGEVAGSQQKAQSSNIQLASRMAFLYVLSANALEKQ